MQAMRAALTILFGLICLFGIVRAHNQQQVPFDRRIGGRRSKGDSPGWYWSMMVLYGVSGVGMLVWGIRELMRGV